MVTHVFIVVVDDEKKMKKKKTHRRLHAYARIHTHYKQYCWNSGRDQQVTNLLFETFYVVRSFRFETDMVALVVIVVDDDGGGDGGGGAVLLWANGIVYTILLLLYSQRKCE